MNISNAIDIKKEKLAREYSKDNPNKIIIKRLKDSIRRHEAEMKKHNRWKARNRRINRERSWKK